jgi:hypothetical protein
MRVTVLFFVFEVRPFISFHGLQSGPFLGLVVPGSKINMASTPDSNLNNKKAAAPRAACPGHPFPFWKVLTTVYFCSICTEDVCSGRIQQGLQTTYVIKERANVQCFNRILRAWNILSLLLSCDGKFSYYHVMGSYHFYSPIPPSISEGSTGQLFLFKAF